MTFVFLASLIGGLLLAVRVMMLGVERPRGIDLTEQRTFRISPQIAVAFAVVFGAAGYVLTRRSPVGLVPATLVAALLGVLASVAAARLVTRWWSVTPEHDVDDERYVLQGHLARVVKPIDSGRDGEVTFEMGSERRVLRARGLDGVIVALGIDVVIERIEGDIAYVEPWSEVEKRL